MTNAGKITRKEMVDILDPEGRFEWSHFSLDDIFVMMSTTVALRKLSAGLRSAGKEIPAFIKHKKAIYFEK